MIIIVRGGVAGGTAHRVGGRRVHLLHGGTAAEDSLRGVPHDHPQCQGLQVSGGQVQGTCLSKLSLIQPIQAHFLPILEFNVKACSYSPTPRPIKSELKRNVWRCSYCTEIDTKADSHWVLC